MHWDSAADFFSMGGYGLYVWGAYGLTAVLFALEGWLAARRRKRAVADVLGMPRSPGSETRQ